MKKILSSFLILLTFLSSFCLGQNGGTIYPVPDKLQLYGLNGITKINGITATVVPVIALTIGNTSVFTAPANSYCFVTAAMYNTGSTTITYVGETSYDGGSTWLLNSSGATNTLAAHTTVAFFSAQNGGILAASEQFGVNTSATNIVLWGTAYCWPSTNVLKKFSKISSWSSGNNTIFTCPTTQCFIVTNAVNNGGLASFPLVNLSGGTTTYSVNLVPNGGSPSAANQIQGTTTTTANNTAIFIACPCAMNNGDYISVNTTSTGSQHVFGWVVEIP